MTWPYTPLDIKNEMYIGGAWVNVTAYTYQRDGVKITRGRRDETQAIERGTAEFTLNDRDGRFSQRNPAGAYYGLLGRNVQCRFSLPSTSATPGYLLKTTLDSGASTVDTAVLDVVGDIDVAVNVACDTWHFNNVSYVLMGKWESVVGNQRSWLLYLFNGYLQFTWTTAGTSGTQQRAFSAIRVPVAAGNRQSVRATLDVNNGAGGWTVTFYTSTDTALATATWTQLGSPVTTAGVTSIFNSTSPLWVGKTQGTTFVGGMTGRYYSAQVRNGIGGTIVANPDFTIQSAGSTGFADAAGRTWVIPALSTGVELITRDIRFWGDLSKLPVNWDQSGTDIYVPAVATGLMQRMAISSAIHSAFYRTYTTGATVRAYWPMEDGDRSTALASGLARGRAMTFTGIPQLASDSSFAGSDDLLVAGTGKFTGIVRNYTSTDSIQVRVCLKIPATGDTDGSNILRLYADGTAYRWDVIYNAAETLTVRGFVDPGVTVVNTTISFVGALHGINNILTLTLTDNGTGIDWGVGVYRQGSGVTGGAGATLASYQAGKATRLLLNADGNLTGSVLGHAVILSDPTAITLGDYQDDGYANEFASDRVWRMGQENGVPVRVMGAGGDTEFMGPQTVDNVLTIMQEAADTNGGILAEARDWPGVVFWTRGALQDLVTSVTLNYANSEPGAYVPSDEDTYIKNDVTVERTSGSASRATQTTGNLAAVDPPDGPGVYAVSYEVNLYTDTDLDNHASWRLHQGTIDVPRYQITANMGTGTVLSNSTLSKAIQNLDLFQRLDVSNPPAWYPDAATTIVQGITEFLNAFEWTYAYDTMPAQSWDALIWDDAKTMDSRWDTATGASTLTTGYSSTATSMVVATVAPQVWTTLAGDFPFDLNIAGERVRVTAISSTTSPQTFTVTRSINAVVKSQSSGALVSLWRPMPWAL